MNEEEEFEFRHRLEQERSSAPQAPTPAQSTTAQKKGLRASDALAPWDAMLHLLTGSVAAPVAGLAGAASLPFKGADAADVVGDVQDALTYQPRTQLGGEMVDVAGSILGLPAQGARYVGEKVADSTGSPALATAADAALQMVPAVIGSRGAAGLRQSSVERAGRHAVKNDTMRRGMDAGYRIPPSELAQSDVASAIFGTLERLGGKDAMALDASSMNNPVVTAGAREYAGIPGAGQISELDFAAARQPHFDRYTDARNMSPAAADAVAEWRHHNARARMHDQHYGRTFDPDAHDAAQAHRLSAEYFDQQLANEARARGLSDVMENLRNARVSLGRIGTIERATNPATGEVSAANLSSARRAGAPLTGQAEVAADMADAFRGRLTQPTALPQGASRGEILASGILSAFSGPKVLALTGVPLLTRRALLSRPVQAAMRPEAPVPLTTVDQLRRAAVISSLGLQGGEQEQ